MKAKDFMTRDMIAVRPDTIAHQLAKRVTARQERTG